MTVELLSRFVSVREQTDVLKRMEKGFSRCCPSAHTVYYPKISNSTIWACFIIDEEQRFGVEHKERVKEMKIILIVYPYQQPQSQEPYKWL